VPADRQPSADSTGRGAPDPDRPEGARRARRAAFLFLVLVAAAVAAALAFRTEIATMAARVVLARMGAPVPALTVERLGLHEAVVSGLTFGKEGRLSADRIAIRYAPRQLLAGRIEAATVDNLRVAVDATASGVSFGDLDPFLRGFESKGGVGPMPRILVHGAAVDVRSPVGDIRVGAKGTLAPDPQGRLSANLDIDVEAPFGTAAGTLGAMADETGVSAHLAIARGNLSVRGAELGGLLGTVDLGRREAKLSVAADLRGSRLTFDGTELGAAALRVDYADEAMTLDASLGDTDRGFSMRLSARARDLATVPALSLDLEARAAAEAGPVWRLLGLGAPEHGTASFNLSGHGTLAEHATEGWAGPAGLLSAGEFEGDARFRAQDVTVRDIASDLDANVAARLALNQGEAVVTLPADASLAARKVLAPIPEAWAEFLPRDVRGPWSLVVPAGGDPAFRLAVRADGAGFAVDSAAAARIERPRHEKAAADLNGRFRLDEHGNVVGFDVPRARVTVEGLALADARVRRASASGHVLGTPSEASGAAGLAIAVTRAEAGPVRVGQADMTLPLGIALNGKRLALSLAKPGRIAAKRAEFADRIGATAPLAIVLRAADAPLLALDFAAGAPAMAHAVRAEAQTVQANVIRTGGPPIPVSIEAARADLKGSLPAGGAYRGEARISAASIEMPDTGLSGERVSGTAAFAAAGLTAPARFEIGALGFPRTPDMLAPLRVEGEVTPAAKAYEFRARAFDTTGTARIVLSGRHAPAPGRGEADIELLPLSFAPGALQPASLVPALSALKQTRGTCDAKMRLDWDQSGLRSGGDIAIGNLSFSSEAAAVEGLNAALRLSSLWPPLTPPDQRLTVRHIDVGVPIDDVEMRFHLEPRADGAIPPRLRIENASTHFAGGRVTISDALLDPMAPRQALAIEAANLDLEQMLKALGVKGLSGTGRLKGRIPIEVGADGIAVSEGAFAAEGEGVIRFRSEAAAAALKQGGPSAELMLQALEDFHYTELRLEIEKKLTGEARMALHLLGRNPAVLEGRLFQFHINIEGNINSLLSALLEAYRASGRFVRRALELRP
jgi:hypothetical protein